MHRRNFLKTSASCGAHVLGLAMFAPTLTRAAFAPLQDDDVIATEKWGRLERIHDGVWALISTPFGDEGDFTTVCNGGIIAGENGVLAVESFMQAKGATWLAEQAKQLTGSWPTDVVSTHYHGDHTAGHKGYFTDDHEPRVWLTESTRAAAEESFGERGMEENEFQNVSVIDGEQGGTIDLGNRQVRLVPRSGHTASDVTIELVEPKVVWCGDLFFNRMFPNYGDAMPGKLNEYSNSIIEASDVTYVPGHGPVADVEALNKYKEFLAYIEEQARVAHDAGKSAEEATGDFELPDSFSEWIVWSPDNATKAFDAWFREWEPADSERSSGDTESGGG